MYFSCRLRIFVLATFGCVMGLFCWKFLWQAPSIHRLLGLCCGVGRQSTLFKVVFGGWNPAPLGSRSVTNHIALPLQHWACVWLLTKKFNGQNPAPPQWQKTAKIKLGGKGVHEPSSWLPNLFLVWCHAGRHSILEGGFVVMGPWGSFRTKGARIFFTLRVVFISFKCSWLGCLILLYYYCARVKTCNAVHYGSRKRWASTALTLWSIAIIQLF